MRPQTISPIPPWLVNTLNSLDVHHPLRALLPEHEIRTTGEDSRPQFAVKVTTPHRQDKNEDDIFAFRPPTMQLHPQPQARKVTPTQAISNTDTITDSEQTTYITQHYESGQSYQYKAQVDPCGVGEGNALQLMTQADDPAPFSRPGPHVIRQPGDLHYYMSVSPHNDLEVNRYDHLSSSPLSNTRGQHSPATPPNEADGFWMSAHDGSLDHHSLLSPPCSPHRLGSSPSRVTSQELAYYDPISKPDYECDLDYSSLDFKWEKFPRDGLVALSARDERLDHPEFVEENPTAEETHNEVVLLPPGTSSESSPHFGFFRREIREVPVTPVRKSRHTQAGAPIQ